MHADRRVVTRGRVVAVSVGGVVAKRVGLGLVAVWGVLTTVFALFTLTGDWVLQEQVGLAKWTGASDVSVESLRQEYLASRGLDRPLLDQYLDWLGNMVTLDWGPSFATGEAAFPVVVDAATRTAMYVLPAVVLAVVGGLLVGLYAALRPGSRLASTGMGTAYLVFALPNFWVGGVALSLALDGVVGKSALVFEHLLPVLLTTTALLGGYASYTRAYGREYATAEFVDLVRAKGASERRVAVHVLRNAAIPVVSMLVTEVLTLLVLAVFVIEALFGIEGLGLVLVRAIETRDLPVLLGGTVVIIAVGVVGSVIQDLSYRALDPRVDTGTR